MKTMQCECGGKGFIIDSRLTGEGKIRRRRVCKRCGKRWTTLELQVSDPYLNTELVELVKDATTKIQGLASEIEAYLSSSAVLRMRKMRESDNTEQGSEVQDQRGAPT